MPLVDEVGVGEVGLPELVADEPNGQFMLRLIAVPEAAPVSHLLADHESKQITLRMRTVEPGVICLKDFLNFNTTHLTMIGEFFP